MACITVAGLLLDAIGALLLVGPEFQRAGDIVRKIQPVGPLIRGSLNKIAAQETIDAADYRAKPFVFFFNRHPDPNVNTDTIDQSNTLCGFLGQIFLNYEDVEPMIEKFDEEKTPFSEEWKDAEMVNSSDIRNRISNRESKWMYQTGVLLLLLGFTLQLVSQLVPISFVRSISLRDLPQFFYTDLFCLVFAAVISMVILWLSSIHIIYLSDYP